MRGYFAEAGYSAAEVDAVLAVRPDRIDLVPLQLQAVRMFNTLPEAPSLAAANKRIGNILEKSDAGACEPSTRRCSSNIRSRRLPRSSRPPATQPKRTTPRETMSAC